MPVPSQGHYGFPRNKSWKPECALSFNMGWRILVFYPEPEYKYSSLSVIFIDFDDAANLFLKQVYTCAVADACLIWTDLIILISRPVR
jgi:hypothetical protein